MSFSKLVAALIFFGSYFAVLPAAATVVGVCAEASNLSTKDRWAERVAEGCGQEPEGNISSQISGMTDILRFNGTPLNFFDNEKATYAQKLTSINTAISTMPQNRPTCELSIALQFERLRTLQAQGLTNPTDGEKRKAYLAELIALMQRFPAGREVLACATRGGTPAEIRDQLGLKLTYELLHSRKSEGPADYGWWDTRQMQVSEKISPEEQLLQLTVAVRFACHDSEILPLWQRREGDSVVRKFPALIQTEHRPDRHSAEAIRIQTQREHLRAEMLLKGRADQANLFQQIVDTGYDDICKLPVLRANAESFETHGRSEAYVEAVIKSEVNAKHLWSGGVFQIGDQNTLNSDLVDRLRTEGLLTTPAVAQ